MVTTDILRPTPEEVQVQASWQEAACDMPGQDRQRYMCQVSLGGNTPPFTFIGLIQTNRFGKSPTLVIPMTLADRPPEADPRVLQIIEEFVSEVQGLPPEIARDLIRGTFNEYTVLKGLFDIYTHPIIARANSAAAATLFNNGLDINGIALGVKEVLGIRGHNDHLQVRTNRQSGVPSVSIRLPTGYCLPPVPVRSSSPEGAVTDFVDAFPPGFRVTPYPLTDFVKGFQH